MSYILDAIKKAEKQRLQEQTPTLESIVSQQPERAGHRGSGRAPILGVVFVLVITTAWFYKPINEAVSERLAPVISWAKGQYSRLSTGDEDETPTVSILESEEKSGQVEQPTQLPAQTKAKAEAAAPKISQDQRGILESINLAVISYSKDANKRFVMDGSKIFREGDSLRGFPIVAIEKSSVVVKVNGQDYRITL